MNFLVSAGLNQMKDQAQGLLPNEGENKEGKKEGEGKGEPEGKEGKDGKGAAKPKKQTKKKKSPIKKETAIRLYSILLLHTMIVTSALIVGLMLKNRNKRLIDNNIINIIIFSSCFVGGTIFSFLLTKKKILSKAFNCLIYIILLGANVIGFFALAEFLEDSTLIAKVLITMFIIFDSGSFIVIIFSMLVKDTPSTFWIMCASAGGNILAIVIMLKVFSYDDFLRKWCLIIFAWMACAIFEVMNYGALDAYRFNFSGQTSIPPMVSLPFELNVCYPKTLWYAAKGIYKLFSFCCLFCCGGKKK